MNLDIKRVAIYARVSTKEQSNDVQVEELKGYAASRGYNVVKIYRDTITGDVAKRKERDIACEFDTLMMDAIAKKFDIILVWKYDRLARTLLHLVQALDDFRRAGVDFISYTQSIDTTTPHGKLFFHMISSIAEFERDMIIERTDAGRRLAMSRGVKFGRKEKVDAKLKEKLVEGHLAGLRLKDLSEATELSINTVYTILKRSLNGARCNNQKCTLCNKYRL